LGVGGPLSPSARGKEGGRRGEKKRWHRSKKNRSRLEVNSTSRKMSFEKVSMVWGGLLVVGGLEKPLGKGLVVGNK